MRTCTESLARAARCLAIPVLTVGLIASLYSKSPAQNFTSGRSVGGVWIDTDGRLQNARADDQGMLSRLRTQALAEVPAPLGRQTKMRKISLRRLEAAIECYTKQGKELPDEIKYLAGLQQIRYIFVDPEGHDIILAGPAEGWKVDRRGFVVGITTGRPVLLLDDLLVAMRTIGQAADGAISCSIDPTAEGLARLQTHVAGLRTIGNPTVTATGIENILGPQMIGVQGVSPTSHFARVLVAADYRMKRLAMGFEPSPVRGLPSYLSMVQAGPRGINNMLPRWWLEPHYEAILHDADGLAWELRGSSVKTMTEEDFLTAGGQRRHTTQANPVAQRWARNMTNVFAELAAAEPIFGQLQNCMDLAIVATVIVKQRLPEKAGHGLPILMQSPALAVEEFAAPKRVASKASLMKKGRNWVISVSGGVKIVPREVLRHARVKAEMKALRIENAVGRHDDWWWN